MLESVAQLVSIARDETGYCLDIARYRVGPGRNAKPAVVVVNGPPKTGTTWMMRMVADLPGFVRVGNLQGNLALLPSVAAGGVVHSHHEFGVNVARLLEAAAARVVTMIRDPRDQVVSHMFHIRRVANHGWHDELSRMSQDEALLACIIGRQSTSGADAIPPASHVVDHHIAWLGSGLESVRGVRYEDLLASPMPSFSSVVEHVGVEPDPRLTASILRRNRFERLTVGKAVWKPMRPRGSADASAHVRSGIAGGWRRYFGPEHVDAFKAVAGDTLVVLGYEAGNDW